MHDQADLQELLAAAQSRVRGARVLLAKPRTCRLDECITLFREAQGYLEWFRDSLHQAEPTSQGLRRHATALAGEISQAGILLEHAARAGRRWLERLETTPPGYTASGECAPRDIRGHLVLLG